MKAIPSIILGTALLLALAGTVAWKYASRARKSGQALAALATSQSRLAAELQHERDRAKAIRNPAPAATPPVPRATASAPDLGRQRFEEAQKDPAVQLLQLAAEKARAARAYGPLFQKLGLTPDQVAKFEDNVAHRNQQLRQANILLRPAANSGVPASPEATAALAKVRATANSDYALAQHELLGTAGEAELAEFERILPAQNTASALAGSAVILGSPFTAQQTRQLAQVLAQNSPAYQTGGYATDETVDWNAVDRQAQSFLSPAQVDILQHVGAANSGRFWGEFSRAMTEADQADAAATLP